MSGAMQLLLGGTPVVPDPYFEYTTLLLFGNGTNGAQNNTFLDSSTNAFSITRNGNTTQGTFSPFSQTGWGAYFNGSSDYISVADSADFTMGSGDFTVQCWVYSTANSGSDQYILGQVNSGGTAAATSFQLYKKATSNVAEAFVYAGATKVATGTAQIPVGQWTHLAMVRDGGTLRLYVNGSQDGTNATLSTTAITDSAGSFSVGRTGDYNGLYFAGYVSNVSVVKGTCLFPSGTTFTPSTTPLSTSTSGQSVLLCQTNRFIDTNTATTAKTVTVGSTSSIQAFSPFNPTAAWSAATNGGSGYFDGSGDYLTFAPGAAFAFGTGDFTVEAWAYVSSTGGKYIIDARNSGQTGAWAFGIDLNAGGNNRLAWYTGSTTIEPTTELVTNAWNHCVYVRSGTTYALFLNGTRIGTGTDSTNYSVSPTTSYVGSFYNLAAYFNGYLANVRTVKGTAVYSPSSTTLTVPTAPLTAITNTSFLLNFTNGAIYDATSKNDLETVGNAQISTTQSKFGGSSMYFDGTGDWLLSTASPNLALGSGDFTIETWVRRSTPGSGAGVILQMSAGTDSYSLLFGYISSSNYVVYISSNGSSWDIADAQVLGAIENDVWVHYALTRYGSTFRTFRNGIQQATWTSSSSIYQATNQVTVGRAQGTHNYVGYMQDVRITKGVARYTANFTPPTSAFPLL